ncbi:DNA-binding transcriptional regulator, AcrR family [Arthrobacter subterraneus]|uniref:DNA-binding transcriptional regulator, AcrR family n=1 Tax=Arthrobacter subterraneus TaxID=335973 RepID=A0A1G8I7K3_9MICC|nr:TetR/AcrR family transcriptional regulator [Arthrobacter subterraneus]SDI14802.1 DNA-binding transcriptional regulator, AcrR family [Arthrobacter subterraneus]
MSTKTTASRGTRGPYAKSAARRREILEAAVSIFGSKGYSGGSIQEVADRAGIAQTTLLHHFPTKEQLLVAVLEYRDEISPNTPGTREHFAEVVAEQAENNEGVPHLIELYSVLCGEATTRDHPAREYFVKRFQRLRAEYSNELRYLASIGRLRPGVDPAIAGPTIVALWDGIQTQWLLSPEQVDMPGTLKAYLDLILINPDSLV